MLETIIHLIGDVILPYLVLSLFAMLLVELIARLFLLRAKTLEGCVRGMLADPEGRGLAGAFYDHPIIQSLAPGGRRPDYIPGRLFALALIDTVERRAETDRFDEAILRLDNETLHRTLQALLRGAPGRAVVPLIQNWFLDVMDRASGLYRWQTLNILACVAALLVLPLNFDAIRISNYVAQRSITEKAVQAMIEAEAKRAASAQPGAETPAAARVAALHSLTFPVGWSAEQMSGGTVTFNWALFKFVGLLTSILAIMLGAPFLFDTLNRFMIVRSTVKPLDTRADAEPPPPGDKAGAHPPA